MECWGAAVRLDAADDSTIPDPINGEAKFAYILLTAFLLTAGFYSGLLGLGFSKRRSKAHV